MSLFKTEIKNLLPYEFLKRSERMEPKQLGMEDPGDP